MNYEFLKDLVKYTVVNNPLVRYSSYDIMLHIIATVGTFIHFEYFKSLETDNNPTNIPQLVSVTHHGSNSTIFNF